MATAITRETGLALQKREISYAEDLTVPQKRIPINKIKFQSAEFEVPWLPPNIALETGPRRPMAPASRATFCLALLRDAGLDRGKLCVVL